MLKPLELFRLDFYRVFPEQHDAACRALEREIRDSGAYDSLSFAERGGAVADEVRRRLPWLAQLRGYVQTDFREGRFYADLYLSDTSGELSADRRDASYRESFELGTIEDGAEDLRAAFLEIPCKVAELLPDSAYIDSDQFDVLVERFDFKRFCADHRLPGPEAVVARARKWN